MRMKALKPQMAQMNTDVSKNAFIYAHLCHLRLTKMSGDLRALSEKV